MKNELRIGNLVSLSLLDGSIEKEVFINEKQLIGIIKGEFLVKPVPITEEWLAKNCTNQVPYTVNPTHLDLPPNNGIDYILNEDFFVRVNTWSYQTKGEITSSFEGFALRSGHPWDSEYLTHIEFIHRLQNAVFGISLTEIPASPAPSINPDIAQAIEK